MYAAVSTPGGNLLCVATASFDAAAKSYSASFPASCIGSPSGVEMMVMFDYESATAQSHDLTAFTPSTSGTGTTTSTTNGLPGTTTTEPETTTTNAVPPETTTVPETTSTILVNAQAATSTSSASTTVAAAATNGTLPRTGSSEVPLILVAFCLIGAGAGLARQRRRIH